MAQGDPPKEVSFCFKKRKEKKKHRHTNKQKGKEPKKDQLVVNFEIYSDMFSLVVEF